MGDAHRTRFGSMPRPARGLTVAFLLAVIVAGCAGQSRAPFRFDTDVFTHAIFSPDNQILNGLMLTVIISVVSQVIGILLGIFGALGRMSRRTPFRWIANFYIWVFRGTPLLVQIVFFFFGLGAAHIYDWPAINLLGLSIPGEIQAGIFALGLNEGAYMSEIVRAGIISIDAGQMEAAKSLGMTFGLGMRRIVLPQAARIIVPPLGNEFNNMLKTTSLLFVISVQELYTTFSIKQSQNFQPFEMYFACALWFLLLTTIWSFIQAYIERRLGKSVAGASTGGRSLRDRMFGARGPVDPSLVSGGR
jgi:polar amino acid transport system permease protein